MRREILAACAAALVVLVGLVVRADEEKVPLEKVPKAVMAAVQKQFPKAKVVSAEKEEVEKKLIFEITIEEGKRRIQVSLTEAGEITEVEKEIPAEDLPKPVKATLEAKYPKATYKLAEEVTKGKELAYEVLLVTAEKKTFEVKLDAEGKVLNVEEKTADDK